MNEEEKKAIENLKIEYEKLIKEGNIFFLLYRSDAKRLINLIDKQNKVIDEESEQLAGLTIWNNNKEEPLILGNKEEIKKYYFRKIEKDE